jgi:sigma-B regulation protein RsbU (phosphoserine phosphatase)
MLLAHSLSKRIENKELNAARIGVLCFVVLALFDNTIGPGKKFPRVEPFGFAIMLGAFGYMAARRILDREVELGEIQKELDLARSIQQSILPSGFPASKSFRVAACYRPMTSVAGDFYDFLVADDWQAGVLVADVSGHGIPAALIASMLKMTADSNRSKATEPAILLQAMNAALHGSTRGEMVTAAYVYLDANAREMRYAAAGHPAMLMLREGAVTEVVENGLPLAAAPTDSFHERTLAISAGDRLLLYTDGLVEARNGAGEMFGEERLTAAFASTFHAATEDAAGRILAAVERWSAQQDDDRTVLVCDYLGTQGA